MASTELHAPSSASSSPASSRSSSTDETNSADERKKKKVKKEKPPGSRSKWSQISWSQRFWWLLITPIRAIICISNVTVFFVTYFGFMIPVLWAKHLWPRFYWYYEGTLYKWLQSFIGYWGYTADYDVYEYGDDISQYCERDRVLVMINHQSTADVPVLFTVLQKKGVATRKTVWLMDIMFRWTPFGIIGNMHGDYFIQQGKATRDKELARLKEHLRKVFWDRDRRWVILFPEGGFYYKRVKSSQEYARRNGYPHLEHTTLPRMGAVKAVLEEVGPRPGDDNDTLIRKGSSSRLRLIKDTVDAIREKKYVKDTRPPIKYVLDVTIAYPNAHPLSLATMLFGTREKCDIAVNYKIYKASEVPFGDDAELQKWMYDVYVKKDKMLDNYYKFGAFHPGETGHRINFAWSRIIGMYTFWLVSFVVQLKVYPWLLHKFFSLLYWNWH